MFQRSSSLLMPWQDSGRIWATDGCPLGSATWPWRSPEGQSSRFETFLMKSFFSFVPAKRYFSSFYQNFPFCISSCPDVTCTSFETVTSWLQFIWNVKLGCIRFYCIRVSYSRQERCRPLTRHSPSDHDDVAPWRHTPGHVWRLWWERFSICDMCADRFVDPMGRTVLPVVLKDSTHC